MRLSEAMNLHVKDIDLSAEPARATLRAEITKGKRARVAYMSDEARDAVKEIVQRADPDRFVFDYSGDIWSRTKITTVTFRRVVERAGLGEKLENHRIHKIHFHLFHKYFLTKGSDVIGEHAAHAICGHGFYMDTYYKKSAEERAADYRKLVPHLTVFARVEPGQADVLSAMNRRFLQVFNFTDEEIRGLGDLSGLSPGDLQKLIATKDGKARPLKAEKDVAPSTGGLPKADLGRIRELVPDGWELHVKDGEVVMRRSASP
jgi:hypothetical protein